LCDSDCRDNDSDLAGCDERRVENDGDGSTIMAKLRLGGLPAAITGDKKLYSKDEYDSNAENEVRK
jgi:hypothetical protein